MKKIVLTALMPFALIASAQAEIAVDDPWIRATVSAQRATGAFMELTSRTDARLVGVASDAAEMVEIHEMTMRDDVMRMRAVDALELPANETLKLQPGGHHIMLIGLREQIIEGDEIELTLTIEDRDGERRTIEVVAPARALTYRQGGSAQPSEHEQEEQDHHYMENDAGRDHAH